MKPHIFTYTAKELIPYIDWSYLFHAWGVGQHSTQHTQAAEEIKREALSLLSEAPECRVKAMFRLCDARSIDDNIELDGTIIPLLRQQHCKDGSPNLCLSDFIAPANDKVGVFATAIEKETTPDTSDDTYKHLLAQTLFDRLAEAAALFLHLEVRTKNELWGYAPNEQLDIEDIIHEKNSGIRPAIGYPSLPDQSIIFLIDKLAGLSHIGIEITANGAMTPHAAVCGLIFAHPAAHYFAVGEISKEQFEDYARRRGIKPEELRRFLVKNIRYNY